MKDLVKECEQSSISWHTNSFQKNKYRVQSLTFAEFCVLPAFKSSSEDNQRGRYNKSSQVRSSYGQTYKGSNDRSSHLNAKRKPRFHHPHRDEPWIKLYKGTTPLSLHDEILLFSQYISPYPEEIAARQDLIERMQTHVLNIWPNAQVVTFGSFTNQTFLPTSDVDIVIQNMPVTNDIAAAIYSLSDSFKSEQARIHHVLIKAKVPLIKLQDAKSGFSVDISFNITNGPENTLLLKKYLDKYKNAVPLLHLLKYLLFSRGLNEPFRGGIGSYALMIMLISFFQMRYKKKDISGTEAPETEVNMEDEDLGVLFQDFLYHYSTEFDNRNKGISIRNGGSYFSKKERGWFNFNTPELFSLEDPHDLGNDVGRTAFASTVVKQEFKRIYDEVVRSSPKEEKTEERTVSRLAQLGLSIDYFISHQREFIKRHSGSNPNGRTLHYTPNASAYQSIALREERLVEIGQRISLLSSQT